MFAAADTRMRSAGNWLDLTLDPRPNRQADSVHLADRHCRLRSSACGFPHPASTPVRRGWPPTSPWSTTDRPGAKETTNQSAQNSPADTTPRLRRTIELQHQLGN